MSSFSLLLILLVLTTVAYYLGKKRAFAVAGDKGKPRVLHSRPTYYGTLTAIWCGIPALLLFAFWLAFESNIITNIVIADLPDDIRNLPKDRLALVVNDIKNLVIGNIVSTEVNATMQAAAEHYRSLKATSNAALAVASVSLAIIGLIAVRIKITAVMRARNQVEGIIKYALIICSTIAIFTTIGIVLSVLYEAVRFFKVIPFTEFLFGLKWSPQMAIRADQVGSSGAFGAIPVFLGTVVISLISMVVAVIV